MNVSQKFDILKFILFFIASEIHIFFQSFFSSTKIYFAYCRNILANSTHNHRTIIKVIASQLFSISKIYNLNNVEKYVYAQKENAKPFSSKTLKKSLIHSDRAELMLSFSPLCTKCIFAEIQIG